MKTYFTYAFADSMVRHLGDCTIRRRAVDAEEARAMILAGVDTAGLNPSHEATTRAVERKLCVSLQIPQKAGSVVLNRGDALLICQPAGLPRLAAEGRTEYTDAEVARATLAFAVYSVE